MYADLLGGRGAAAQEVHHIRPLKQSVAETVETMLDDVIALCASCHRIIQTAPTPTREELQIDWTELTRRRFKTKGTIRPKAR